MSNVIEVKNLVKKYKELTAVMSLFGVSFAFLLVNLLENNNMISELEKFDFDSLKPILINALVILGATALVVIINNIVTRKKQKS